MADNKLYQPITQPHINKFLQFHWNKYYQRCGEYPNFTAYMLQQKLGKDINIPHIVANFKPFDPIHYSKPNVNL